LCDVVQVKGFFSNRISVRARFLGVDTLFFRPGTLNEALEALAQTGGTILAGGTDLFPASTGSQLSGAIIDISRVAELKGIRFTEDFVEIGARTTWSEVLTADLPCGFDGLRAAAREVGSIQIQNSATVAGNICNASPAADGVAALLALDAELTLASPTDSRKIALADFIQGNRKTARRTDEILTCVRIPRRWEKASSSFLKLGARRYLVISIVMVAVNLIPDSDGRVGEAAVCLGSCSPKALRLQELEQALAGVPIGPRLLTIPTAAHFASLSPIDDVRATAAYRQEAAQTLVRRALEECVSKAS
jgi:CO/xanthine dehydrogenase FAD-binding subunit